MDNPNGKSTVTPYVAAAGAARFLDFVEEVFETAPAVRVPTGDGLIGHAEIRIGDSVIMAFDRRPGWPHTPSFLSVYVADADAVVARALQAGATLVTEVVTAGILGDRVGRVQDPTGTIWWIQTRLEDVGEAETQRRFADPDELAVLRTLESTFDAAMRTGPA